MHTTLDTKSILTRYCVNISHTSDKLRLTALSEFVEIVMTAFISSRLFDVYM